MYEIPKRDDQSELSGNGEVSVDQRFYLASTINTKNRDETHTKLFEKPGKQFFQYELLIQPGQMMEINKIDDNKQWVHVRVHDSYGGNRSGWIDRSKLKGRWLQHKREGKPLRTDSQRSKEIRENSTIKFRALDTHTRIRELITKAFGVKIELPKEKKPE